MIGPGCQFGAMRHSAAGGKDTIHKGLSTSIAEAKTKPEMSTTTAINLHTITPNVCSING